MSELKDKLTKEVSEIEQTISNPEEKAKVLSVIQDMIGEFSKCVVILTERQNELDEKVTEIYDVLTDIEMELVNNLAESVEAECPYCGEVIPLEFEDGEFTDFECPNCHNVIEMEMMLDNCHCDCDECNHEEHGEDDCDGNCGHCGGCEHSDEDEE